jgi:hypothetical protein
MNTTTLGLVGLVVLTVGISCAHAGEDATCKLVYDAIAKGMTTPNHSYMKLSLPAVNGGKPADSEIINTGKARYTSRAAGKWASSMSTQEVLDQMTENRRDNESTCRLIRDETIDGVSASLYETKEDTELTSKIWLSKSNGLPVHVITDSGGMHSETRYVNAIRSIAPLHWFGKKGSRPFFGSFCHAHSLKRQKGRPIPEYAETGAGGTNEDRTFIFFY